MQSYVNVKEKDKMKGEKLKSQASHVYNISHVLYNNK